MGDKGKYVKAPERLCGLSTTSHSGSRCPQGCRGQGAACRSVTFHRLPARKELQKRWLAAIPRVNTPITKNSYVCGQHFQGGQRRGIDDVPCVFEGKKAVRARQSFSSTGRIERFNPCPPSSTSSNGSSTLDEKEADAAQQVPPCPEIASNVVKALDDMTLREQVKLLQEQLDQAKRETEEYKEALKKAEAQINAFGFSYASKDDKVFKFYTGLHIQDFNSLLDIIGDSAERMDYSGVADSSHEGRDNRGGTRKLSQKDELFLTLCKLRHDFPESDLAARFQVSQPTISRIFRTWVLCLSFSFQEIDIWPSKEHLSKFMPDAFKVAYPSTRVIIDATEFPIEKPSNPDVQATTWSSYKNRNTLKVLVGCSPNGALTYLSDVYGGRITDKELTRRSGLMVKLDRGDSIMADRGFEVDHLLPEGVQCNIPPFLDGRPQLEPHQVISTRQIATLRIHVERAIERIKNFQITSFFPISLCPIAGHIISACAFLTLFEEPLVPVGGKSSTHLTK